MGNQVEISCQGFPIVPWHEILTQVAGHIVQHWHTHITNAPENIRGTTSIKYSRKTNPLNGKACFTIKYSVFKILK